MNRIGCCLAAVTLFAACSHAKKSVTAEESLVASEPASVASAERSPDPPASTACTTDDQCKANELCVSSKCVSISAELGECRKASAHFEFDSAQLRSDDLPKLRRVARCMEVLPAVGTLLEGNCDERGTSQYNIALGFRRAHSVAKYLQDLGVNTSRMSEVSYGEELPACTEPTEACWSTNRRTDIARGAKAKDLRTIRTGGEQGEEEALGEAAAASVRGD